MLPIDLNIPTDIFYCLDDHLRNNLIDLCCLSFKRVYIVSIRNVYIKYIHLNNIFRKTLQLRNNERDGVSNHQHLDCLLNRLFRRTSKKSSKLRFTGLCERWIPLTKGK